VCEIAGVPAEALAKILLLVSRSLGEGLKKGLAMKIGVVACNILQRELDMLLADVAEIEAVVYLDGALHVSPLKMKETIRDEVNKLKGRVDVVFLGYGYCQSLKGLDEEFDFPVILPQVDDCIGLLMTPERYAEEVRKEVGTWFMTPGWAEVGAEMVIKELHLDRARKYGKDPLEMARRLFTHYKRGLFIDTGVGDDEHFIAKAEEFCRDFNLVLEKTEAKPTLLAAWLEKCRDAARSLEAARLSDGGGADPDLDQHPVAPSRP
jgi:hypothetical protein